MADKRKISVMILACLLWSVLGVLRNAQNCRVSKVLAGLLQSGFLGIVFPKDGVKVGDKWTNKVDIAKQMGLPPNVEVKNPDMTVTYVLKSIDRNGDRAVISINATGNPSISSQMMAGGRGSDGNTQTQARTMTFKMTMSMTGTATLDLSSGVLRTAEYRLKIGTDGGPALANQDMTVKIERQ